MKQRLTLNLLLIDNKKISGENETFSCRAKPYRGIIDAMIKNNKNIFPFIYLSFALWINKNQPQASSSDGRMFLQVFFVSWLLIKSIYLSQRNML